MGTLHDATIREFREPDLAAVRQLICQTIEACYAGVYPPRAVTFFKSFHAEEKIMERHRVGKVLVVERSGRVIATGTVAGYGMLEEPSLDVGEGQHLDFWQARKWLGAGES